MRPTNVKRELEGFSGSPESGRVEKGRKRKKQSAWSVDKQI